MVPRGFKGNISALDLSKEEFFIPVVIFVDVVEGVPGRLGRATTQSDWIPTNVQSSTKSFSKSPVGLYFSGKKENRNIKVSKVIMSPKNGKKSYLRQGSIIFSSHDSRSSNFNIKPHTVIILDRNINRCIINTTTQ